MQHQKAQEIIRQSILWQEKRCLDLAEKYYKYVDDTKSFGFSFTEKRNCYMNQEYKWHYSRIKLLRSYSRFLKYDNDNSMLIYRLINLYCIPTPYKPISWRM